MTVELWMGREYEHTHEMKALGEFLTGLEDLIGEEDDLYLVMASFFCQGEEIDLAVLKQDGVVIIELKDIDRPLKGGENGTWTILQEDGSRHPLNADRGRNPYQQARTYRFALMNQLQKDARKIMPGPKAQQMRFDHISSLVVLRPREHPACDITVGRSSQKWFDVVGLDELPREVYQRRSPKLNFRPRELQALAELWGLSRTPLERFIPGAGPEKPAPTIPEEGKAEKDKPASGAPHVRPRTPPPEDCFVCGYTRQPCQIPHLRGTLKRILTQSGVLGEESYLELDLPDRKVPVLLEVGPRWSRDFLFQLKKALAEIQDTSAKHALTITAYHLQKGAEGGFRAGEESLIILEPDWLIKVTDLRRVEYCPREYLGNHFTLLEPNKYLVRGNIVHQTFEGMVKNPHDQEAITESLKEAFFQQTTNLALLGHSQQGTWERVRRPYQKLTRWIQEAHLPESVSTETFVFAPQIGLKGKIDALWSKNDRPSLVGELKSGKSKGPKPKPGHHLQVAAYSLMLLSRTQDGDPVTPKASLLYAGNPDLRYSLNLIREIDLDPNLFREVIDTRNQLVLIDYLAGAPFETEYKNKCNRCHHYQECEALSLLLDHEDPRPASFKTQSSGELNFTPAETEWFQTYTRLLSREFRAAKEAHAVLWRMAPEEREAEGTMVFVEADPQKRQEGIYRYFLPADNNSELREEDYVMVSDEGGPLYGNLAQGTIKKADETGLEIEFRSPLEFSPAYVDKYVTENLVKRQFAGPYLWLRDHPKKDLLIPKQPPRFTPGIIEPTFPPVVGSRELNQRQQLAVVKTLHMQDYLLIHGPPGSGKTLLIQALVRELVHRDQRVLIAAGTNTAIDNALSKIRSPETEPDLLRLGSPSRTEPDLRPFTLSGLATSEDLDTRIAETKQALTEKSIVAGTATTLLSGEWDLPSFPPFDVAIVDEAAQLTLPATLGSLRLAKRFVLIGDHKQLPAVVLSEDTGDMIDPGKSSGARLSESLFEQLYAYLEREYPEGIVHLNEQYRMNEDICAIPRQIWYKGKLAPATPEIGNARLSLLRELSPEEDLFSLLDPEVPVVFSHVSWDALSPNPRTNQVEAQKVKEILAVYRDHGLSFDNVGIIAPFRAQVAAIRRELEEAFSDDDKKAIRQAVDTVDRFQGQEKELIIVSLATYGDFVHELLQDQRRLNVALTRAKHKLILLGDSSVLRREPVYAQLIQHCQVFRS